MQYIFNPTRGSSEIAWDTASTSPEPSLDPPEYWEIESDRREDLCSPQNPCLDDFDTSLEPD